MRVTKRNWTVSMIYFIVVMLTLVLRISFSLGLSSYVPINSDYLFTISVQIVIFGIVPFVMYSLSQFSFSDRTLPPLKSMAWRFGFTKKVSGRNWLRIIAITFLMMFTATFISWMWQSVLSALGFVQTSSRTEYANIGVLFMQLLMVGVLPAIFEEFTHRGLIFAGFRSNNLKNGWKLVLISALFFSLMHQNIRQTGYTFYDGIIMGLLCYYTGSIFPSMFAHFINNAGAVLSDYSSQQGGLYAYVDRIYDWLMSSAAGFAVFMFSVILAISLLILLFYRMRNDFIKEQTDIRLKRAVADGDIFVVDESIVTQKVVESDDANLNMEINASDNLVQSINNSIVSDALSSSASDSDLNNENDLTSEEKTETGKMYPINETTLPDDFSKDFDKPDRHRKQVWVWVTIGVGVACAVLSFVWGMLR